jgi:hypothetical protein
MKKTFCIQGKQLYGDWEPYAQTRQAMEFIDQHAEKPFASFLSWHPPHNWPGGHEAYAAPDDCLYDRSTDPAATSNLSAVI